MKESHPYDKLYLHSKNHILWGEKPGRIIRNIRQYLTNGRVLDAGCGDGKNALYLEQMGFDVVGYDISNLAIKGLDNRFKKLGVIKSGEYHVKDIIEFDEIESFDAVISYGLLHSLPKASRYETHVKLQKSVKIGGWIFFTCLLDSIPLPFNHATTNVALVSKREVERLFKDWEFHFQLEDTIEEEHPPLVETHQHAAIWIIAKRII